MTSNKNRRRRSSNGREAYRRRRLKKVEAEVAEEGIPFTEQKP
jgi:hypothetical protein